MKKSGKFKAHHLHNFKFKAGYDFCFWIIGQINPSILEVFKKASTLVLERHVIALDHQGVKYPVTYLSLYVR